MKPTPDQLPRTVSEMLRSHGEAFYTYQAENVQSCGYSHSQSRRDRYSRCYDAAEHGSDGSTHAENIEDFREFGEHLFREANRMADRMDFESDEAADAYQDAIDNSAKAYAEDCDKLEAWHENNGSLNQQVG